MLQAVPASLVTCELAGVAPGRQILDLGCGTGDDALAMARRLGGSGEIVVVDPSAALIREAQKRAEGAGLPVRFAVGDPTALPFPENCFDGCRADRFFQRLADPEAALAEMVRASKPGAPVVVSDTDFGTLVLDTDDRPLATRVQAFLCQVMANPCAGRRLPSMFCRAGLTDLLVQVEFQRFDLATLREQLRLPHLLQMMQERGEITAGEAASFMAELELRTAEGTFFGGASLFIVAGHKRI